MLNSILENTRKKLQKKKKKRNFIALFTLFWKKKIHKQLRELKNIMSKYNFHLFSNHQNKKKRNIIQKIFSKYKLPLNLIKKFEKMKKIADKNVYCSYSIIEMRNN